MKNDKEYADRRSYCPNIKKMLNVGYRELFHKEENERRKQLKEENNHGFK